MCSVTVVRRSSPLRGIRRAIQSFLVHLDKTGWLLLTGDAVYFKDNWDNDRVPSMNTSAEQTHISHARLAGIVAEKKAGMSVEAMDD
jgi:hypothetical protein